MKISGLFIGLLLLAQISAKAQQTRWVENISSTGNEFGNAIVLDNTGNYVYIAGYYDGSITTDAGTVNSHGEDILVAKFKKNGDLMWVRTAGASSGSSNDEGQGIAIDEFDNIYVTGFYSGTVSFSGMPLTSAGNNDIFVAKYSKNGTLLHVASYGGTDADEGKSVAINSDNEVIFAGSYKTSGTFGSYSISGVSTKNSGFVCKADTTLSSVAWVTSVRCTSSAHVVAYGVDVDKDDADHVYVTGSFNATTSVYENTGSSVASFAAIAGMDIYLVKLNDDGTYNSNVTFGENGMTSYDQVSKAVRVKDGYVYITGYIEDGAVDFDPSGSTANLTPDSGSDYDVFFLKLSTSFGFQWVRGIGGTYKDEGRSIDVDASDNCYISGGYRDAAYFYTDGATPTRTLILLGGNGNNVDMYIAKLNSSGTLSWAEGIGYTLIDLATDLVFDEEGNADYVYITGGFDDNGGSPVNFDPYGSSSTYDLGSVNQDLFVLKLTTTIIPKMGGMTEESLRIYPNPSSAIYTVTLPNAKYINSILYVKDIEGHTIKRINITDINTKLDMYGIANGTYFIQIENADFSESYKILLIN